MSARARKSEQGGGGNGPCFAAARCASFFLRAGSFLRDSSARCTGGKGSSVARARESKGDKRRRGRTLALETLLLVLVHRVGLALLHQDVRLCPRKGELLHAMSRPDTGRRGKVSQSFP